VILPCASFFARAFEVRQIAPSIIQKDLEPRTRPALGKDVTGANAIRSGVRFGCRTYGARGF
jgi:hypothetical protein